MRQLILIVAVVIMLVACRASGRNTDDQGPVALEGVHFTATSTATPRPSPSPMPSPTATNTATPTATATPTPTATPTGRPISVTGDPRLAALAKLSPQDDSDCGLVDIFDFPLNPPDGEGVARGGTDFGIYRDRYEMFHTGEDWWTSRGGSFGTPVYSIGHGRVTYAAPLGWGRDQGVVIIRHTFNDGRQLLSFYGHLDPPSVTLRAGECVKRGQQVGNIGRPRTPPHLHFEIRTHMPNEPGGGYWWQDPTLDGWLPPSQTVWEERLRNAPGVEWLRVPESRDSVAVGLQGQNTVLLLKDEQIIGLDSASGEERWSIMPEVRPEAAVADSSSPTFYVADRHGRVQAMRLTDATADVESDGAGEAPETLWSVDLDMVGMPQLIPLPGGGIMMVTWSNTLGLSSEGKVLWQSEELDRPVDWVPTDDNLLVSTFGNDRSLWTIDESGPHLWRNLNGGALADQSDHVLLFNDEGLFQLDPADRSGVLQNDWPKDVSGSSDVIDLEDGGALVSYYGLADRRLIRFDAQGNMLWQRSVPDEIPGAPILVRMGDELYLIASEESRSNGTISIYSIDLENANLVHLFKGGTRNPRFELNSFQKMGSNRLLLKIGGGHLISLNLASAMEGTAMVPDSLPQ